GATVLPVWLEVICSDLILLFLPLVGPLSSWWGVGVFLLLNKPQYVSVYLQVGEKRFILL
ncbi:hypothetical protein, partial [Rothia endophytica]|uniref:hypothetical protein n=1 Tax=Rothia endophytica TaxID=1324766 RepID=UPI0031EA410B